MQPDLHSRALAAHTLHQFRTLSPLTHCMTNEVVQSFTANTLLALGASPAMVIEPEEASQFAAIASALLVNVGTLTQERATAMRAAVERAYHAKTPWTLDPVAVGALEFRRRFCLDLLSLQPAAIRGNASEILALAGMNGGGRGVDTTDTASGSAGAGSSDWDHCRGYRRSGLRHRWSAYRWRGRRRPVNDLRGGHRMRAISGCCSQLCLAW